MPKSSVSQSRVKFCAKLNELNSLPMRSHSASNVLASAYVKKLITVSHVSAPTNEFGVDGKWWWSNDGGGPAELVAVLQQQKHPGLAVAILDPAVVAILDLVAVLQQLKHPGLAVAILDPAVVAILDHLVAVCATTKASRSGSGDSQFSGMCSLFLDE